MIDYLICLATALALAAGLQGCIPEECREHKNEDWNFQLQASITPALDTFAVGDTFNLRSRFHHSVPDLVSGEDVIVQNYTFYSFFAFDKVDRYDELGGRYEDGIALNQVNSQIGEWIHNPNSNGAGSLIIQAYEYQKDFYDFGVSVTLLTPGTYVIVCISSLGSDIIPDNAQEPNAKIVHVCAGHRSRPFAQYIMNDGDVYANNLDIFRASNAPDALTRSESDYKRAAFYTFVVE